MSRRDDVTGARPGGAAGGRAEVVVVGAGPAGCATALHLARRGRRVVLLERTRGESAAATPADEPAWALTRDAVRLLLELGVPVPRRAAVGGFAVSMRGRGTRLLRYGSDGLDGGGAGAAHPVGGEGPVGGTGDAGAVVQRHALVGALLTAARAAGVRVEHGVEVVGLVPSGPGAQRRPGAGVGGVVVRGGDGVRTARRCRVVVAADGAAGVLSALAGLRAAGRSVGPSSPGAPDHASPGAGRAAHVVLTGAPGAPGPVGPGPDGDLVALHLPLADATDRHVLPSCGWVLPAHPAGASRRTGEADPAAASPRTTVGVALLEPAADEPAADEAAEAALDRFLTTLAARDPWFAAAHRGDVRTGALRTDLDPARSAVPGLVLVGDAAGLASAFTAEGVSGALTSADVAARAVDAALAVHAGADVARGSDVVHGPDGPGAAAPGEGAAVDLTGYGAALGRRFAGWSTTGDGVLRRYHLAWRVLQSTFDDDRPLFVLSRRAVLFPESARVRVLLDPLPAAGTVLTRRLRRALVDVAEVLAATVREHWPMFVHVAGVEDDLAGLRLRPSVLLLVAAWVADGRPQGAPPGGRAPARPPVGAVGGRVDDLATALAAAVDLAALSALASDSTADAPRAPREHAGGGGSPVTGGPATGGATPGGPVPWGNRFAVLVADHLMARAYRLAVRGGAGAVTLFADALGAACEGRVLDLRATAAGRVDDDERLATLERTGAAGFELPCRLGALTAGCSPQRTDALARYGRRLGVAYALLEELRRAAGAAPPWLPVVAGVGSRVPDVGVLRERAVAGATSARAALRGVPHGEARDLLDAIAAAVAAEAGGGPG